MLGRCYFFEHNHKRASADDDSAITAAANLIDVDVEALEDLHGSAEYRRRVARGLTRRAIQEAIAVSGT